MKRMLGSVVVFVLALSGCTAQKPDQEIPIFTPTPIGEPSSSSTPTREPTQQELSAMAEASYRAFFTEWARLELEGGAEDPTPILLAHGAEDYLDGVMTLLRDQKKSGYRISGPIPIPSVQPAPGEALNRSDPRLTLKVCEDGSQGIYIEDGVEQPGQIVEGLVYLRMFGNTPKLVAGSTKSVEKCSF